MALETPHVLAVDDSLVDRKVIERLLKISACRVTTAESGRQALQFLGLDGEQKHELKVNLILTDYCMPGMNGFELLKKIKESAALREIPVVIMSSENVVARIDRCLEEGAEEFLVKPVKLSDLKRLKGYIVKNQNCQPNQTLSRKRPLPSSSPPLPPPLPPPPSLSGRLASSLLPWKPSSSKLPSPSSPSRRFSSPLLPSSPTSSCHQEIEDIGPTSPSSEPPQKIARLDPQAATV